MLDSANLADIQDIVRRSGGSFGLIYYEHRTDIIHTFGDLEMMHYMTVLLPPKVLQAMSGLIRPPASVPVPQNTASIEAEMRAMHDTIYPLSKSPKSYASNLYSTNWAELDSHIASYPTAPSSAGFSAAGQTDVPTETLLPQNLKKDAPPPCSMGRSLSEGSQHDLPNSDEKDLGDALHLISREFKMIGQTACKKLARVWIYSLDPSRQAKYPYTKRVPPDWWPATARYSDPFHLHTRERLAVLRAIVLHPRASLAKLDDAASRVFNSEVLYCVRRILHLARKQRESIGIVDSEQQRAGSGSRGSIAAAEPTMNAAAQSPAIETDSVSGSIRPRESRTQFNSKPEGASSLLQRAWSIGALQDSGARYNAKSGPVSTQAQVAIPRPISTPEYAGAMADRLEEPYHEISGGGRGGARQDKDGGELAPSGEAHPLRERNAVLESSSKC